MSLSFRPARAADLPRCQALLTPLVPAVYEPEVWAALPELWLGLLAERRLEIHLFEDSARPAAQTVCGMATGVFIAPEFAGALLTCPQPSVANHVYRRELLHDSVILTRAAVGRANAGGGLDVLGLDYSLELTNWADLTGLRLLPLMAESLQWFIGGYQIKSLHRELFGRPIHLLARAGGWRRRRVDSGKRAPEPRDSTRAAVYGLTRDEVLKRPGTAASLYFLYQEPKLGFTPAQQDLLNLALRGQADTDAASALGISLSTVKKHWEAIFERVSRVRPDWLPEAPAAMDTGKRGAEKRRHLLNHLRHHLEELRPRD